MAFDPHYASVSLLLHCDGANGSTAIIDSSPAPKTVTAAGDAKISTAQSRFGGASLLLDGAGDYLSVPANADFTFGTGDFALEAWVKTTDNGEKQIIDQYTTGLDTWQWAMKGGKLSWYHRTDGVKSYALTGAVSVNDGLWHHVAAARNSGVLRFFVDGVLDGSIGNTANYLHNITLGIGAQVASRNDVYDFVGAMDDVRITKGVARYTANFTPPTDPFPDSSTAPVISVRASAPATLGTPAALALHPLAARIAAPTPLQAVQALIEFNSAAKSSAAAPSPLGAAQALAQSALASVQPMAYASAPAALGSVQVLAMTTAYALAASPSPLAAPALVANFDDGLITSLGQSTQFGPPSLVSVHRAQEGVQLIPFIPPLIAGYTATFGTVVAQQERSIAAPVFGTPSVSFSTTHQATSIEASAAFGTTVAQSIHAAQSLEPVVFGAIGDPSYSAQASSLSGQTAFGQPVSATVHPVQDWYAGIRIGPLASSSFGSFQVLDSIQLTEFGEPRLGATAHRVMPLHLMPQFGPITISRGTMQC